MKNYVKIGTIAGMITALLALCITFVVAGTPAAGKGNETVLQVANLSCGACAKNIEGELRKHKGMKGMSTDIAAGLITIKHTAELPPERLAELVTAAGYPATVAPVGTATVQTGAGTNQGCKGCTPKGNGTQKCNTRNCDPKNCDPKNCDTKNCDPKNCDVKNCDPKNREIKGCDKKGCKLPPGAGK